jgi:hypothetical protein
MGFRSQKGKASVNILPREKRIAVLAALVEGNSERAVERMTEVNRKTIGRLVLELGCGAQRLHDRIARDLTCSQVVADEIWSYVGVKEARVRPDHPEGSGEAYTFVSVSSREWTTDHARVKRREGRLACPALAPCRDLATGAPEVAAAGFERGHSRGLAYLGHYPAGPLFAKEKTRCPRPPAR